MNNLVILLAIVVLYWVLKARHAVQKETFKPHGDEFAQVQDIPLGFGDQRSKGKVSHGLPPRTSTADAELSILKDYFNDYKQYKPKPRHRDREIMPFNTSVYGPDGLQPVQMHPMEFILDPVMENVPTVQDQVVSSLSGFLDVEPDKLRSGLNNMVDDYA